MSHVNVSVWLVYSQPDVEPETKNAPMLCCAVKCTPTCGVHVHRSQTILRITNEAHACIGCSAAGNTFLNTTHRLVTSLG